MSNYNLSNLLTAPLFLSETIPVPSFDANPSYPYLPKVLSEVQGSETMEVTLYHRGYNLTQP